MNGIEIRWEDSVKPKLDACTFSKFESSQSDVCIIKHNLAAALTSITISKAIQLKSPRIITAARLRVEAAELFIKKWRRRGIKEIIAK